MARGERLPRTEGLEGAGDPAIVERAWVKRAQAGDADAFRAIFERYAPGLRRFLRDLTRNDAAADEATQETFVRAHRRLDSLREGHKLAAWLFGIARNVLFEHRRALAAEVSDEDAEAVVEAVLPAPSPEALVLDRELEGALDAALAALSPPRRAALLLRIDHGLGYEEIAEAMGWTLPKVKNEIHRARLRLRATLAAHLKEEPWR